VVKSDLTELALCRWPDDYGRRHETEKVSVSSRRKTMSRSKLLVILTTVFLIAAPIMVYAQVTNLALNPSFEEDEVILDDPAWEKWATWGWEDGVNSIIELDNTEFIDGIRSLRVEPKGAENWYFIVLNLPMDVNVGGTYTISFWAKAKEARPFGAKMKATDNSIDFCYTDFNLTTEWSEYVFTCDPQAAQVKLEMFCAGSEIPFWLDFVNVYEGTYVEGIMPSEAASSVEPVGKLPIRWAALKIGS